VLPSCMVPRSCTLCHTVDDPYSRCGRLFGKMMDVYGGTLRLEVVDIFANDNRGVVLTRETGTTDGETVKWSGVHIWSFRDGRCTQFVAYADAIYQRFWSTKTRAAAPTPSNAR
jgi:hypothetical protein